MDQKHHSLSAVLALCLTALLLGGCPSHASRDATPESESEQSPLTPIPVAPAPAAPRPAPPPRENHLSPATRSLVTQAQGLLAKGDLIGASATLDRALRIEPNNPLLWIERGRVRLAQSDARQAEGCAHKALALASGDRATQKQAGRLLADALRVQQRNPEAQEVESRPYMH
jgi:tetratricopeptide (TPR) repeat protein